MLDKIRIFEVKGLEIDLSALPAGSTQTEWTTVIDYIRPADFESNFAKHSGKILANLKPRDGKLLMQLDSQIAQNPSHVTLSVDFQEMLLTASTAEYVQVKEIKLDKNTQKRFLEVVRTCEVEEDDQQNGDNWIGFQTNYFLMSNF